MLMNAMGTTVMPITVLLFFSASARYHAQNTPKEKATAAHPSTRISFADQGEPPKKEWPKEDITPTNKTAKAEAAMQSAPMTARMVRNSVFIFLSIERFG